MGLGTEPRWDPGGAPAATVVKMEPGQDRTSSLQPSDLALLMVLGTAERAPVTFAAIVDAARQLAPRDWQPTADILRTALQGALAEGLVSAQRSAQPATANSGDAWQTTPAGRRRIVDLLCTPIPQATGGFLRACTSAKLRFLHHLPQPQRLDQAAALALMYRDIFEVLRLVPDLPRPIAGSLLDHLRQEMAGLQTELTGLDGLDGGIAWTPSRHV